MTTLRHGVEEPGDVQDIRLVVDTIPTLAWSAGPDGSAEFHNQRRATAQQTNFPPALNAPASGAMRTIAIGSRNMALHEPRNLALRPLATAHTRQTALRPSGARAL
jgi:hypothetical protein